MELTAITAKRAYFDTNAFIYLIEENLAYVDAVVALIAHLESQNCTIITSELTVAECLVKPFQEDDRSSQDVYMQSITTSDFLMVKPVSKKILIEAARLRAVSKNKLPDSIHLATALSTHCEIFVGNDKKLKTCAGIKSVILSDLAFQ